MRLFGFIAVALVLPSLGSVVDADADLDTDADLDVDGHHHHHGHHHGHHKKKKSKQRASDKQVSHVVTSEPKSNSQVVHAAASLHPGNNIVDKMKQIEERLQKRAEEAKKTAMKKTQGHLLVNGPLPSSFNDEFSKAVGTATSSDPKEVKVTDATAVEDSPGVVEVAFVAAPKVVKEVEDEAADPESKLAQGNMHSFLVSKDSDEQKPQPQVASKPKGAKAPKGAAFRVEATPVEEKGIDIDTSMPYGDLEPFGREDTAQELTESSVKESDEMVDQLERAEVAEEKRSVFRALTRLRGAAITSFDGVARSQTGNIDEYNKVHKWRHTHPLHHLADEESDVQKWAFPDNADF